MSPEFDQRMCEHFNGILLNLIKLFIFVRVWLHALKSLIGELSDKINAFRMADSLCLI